MNFFKPILRLTTIAVIMTFGLFGFTIATIGIDPEIEQESWACGTAALEREPTRKLSLSAEAELGEALFIANCKTCHRMVGTIIGPPLQGVYERTDSTWLRRWITNSSQLIKEGDPYAVALFNEYNKVQMTAFTGLSETELDALIAYLKEAGKP